ncbi:MAG: cytochrome c [Steroidobacteraceae bacterium]|jgi:mono/diheme cytochrome c family protein
MPPRNVLSLFVLAGVLAACSPKGPGEPQGAAGVSGSTVGATAKSAGPTAAEIGERIYSGNCVPCHQQSGAGIPGVYPSLAGSPVVTGDPAELARWVMQGQRPPSMPAGRYSTQMLQFGWMKPADAAALFTYLRSSFGNAAPPVGAATVAKALGQ